MRNVVLEAADEMLGDIPTAYRNPRRKERLAKLLERLEEMMVEPDEMEVDGAASTARRAPE